MGTKNHPGLHEVTAGAVIAQSIIIQLTENNNALSNLDLDSISKLAALVESVGRISGNLKAGIAPVAWTGTEPDVLLEMKLPELEAERLNYIAWETGIQMWRDQLVRNLLHLSASAAMWAESLDNGGN